jgi:pimeloyl-ACP methyl ester carboxylesterase
MKYFNGFSLHNEANLFADFIVDSQTTVAGFSYGAQLALEYVYTSKERIDKLILLSPAFFQTQKSSFIRTQLRYFEADKQTYIKQFLENVSYPSGIDLVPYLQTGTKEELYALLTYVWEVEKIQTLIDKGITIEVFLGEEDKIIQSKDALAFFSKLCTTYSIKNAGHSLGIKI